MKKTYGNKGMTLVEIIIAMAILAIMSIALLSLFGYGYSTILVSGHKTEKAMELQSVIDDFNSQTFYFKNDIINYTNSKGYNPISDINQITVKAIGKDINIYIGDQETKSDSPGFQVTVLKFYQNDKFTVKASTFVIKGGF